MRTVLSGIFRKRFTCDLNGDSVGWNTDDPIDCGRQPGFLDNTWKAYDPIIRTPARIWGAMDITDLWTQYKKRTIHNPQLYVDIKHE